MYSSGSLGERVQKMSSPSNRQKCTLCRQNGHNSRTCLNRGGVGRARGRGRGGARARGRVRERVLSRNIVKKVNKQQIIELCDLCENPHLIHGFCPTMNDIFRMELESNASEGDFIENIECAICLERILKANVQFTCCSHAFHAACLVQALERKNECPTCKTVQTRSVSRLLG